MKVQNLSVKRLFGRVAMELVLSMSGITIALFLVTKQIAVLLTGGALLLCAIVGIFVLTQAFGKRLSQFTTDLCQTLDHMGTQQQRPACQQHRRLFCHKKQDYGDPGHGEDKPYCHPAKQPLYREAVSYTHLFQRQFILHGNIKGLGKLCFWMFLAVLHSIPEGLSLIHI